MQISELLGKTLTSVDVNSNGAAITFTTSTGVRYHMYHQQDCCESVEIESIVGDLSDLCGSPILLAEEATGEKPADARDMSEDNSVTWTFYKLATIKGYVDIRWFGTSNGYYSESVDFVRLVV